MPSGRTFVAVLSASLTLSVAGWAAAPGAQADHSRPLVPATDKPSAPTEVHADEQDRALTVTWSAPAATDGVATEVEHYDVTLVALDDDTAPRVVAVDGDQLEQTVSSLRNGERYLVEVTARNSAGSSEADTATGTPRTVPGAPSLGNVNAGNASAVVSWTRPGNDGGAPIQHYVIESSEGDVKQIAGDSTRTTVRGLENGVATTFKIAAVNVAGRGAASLRSRSVIPRAPAQFDVERHPVGRVVYGSTSTVRTRLVTAGGIGVPDERVHLQAKRGPGSRWRSVASGLTGTDGQVTLRTALRASSALRLRHRASAVAAPKRDVRRVVVAKHVAARPERTRTREGMPVVVRGRVAPGQDVASPVRLQRRVSGSWTAIAKGRMTSRERYVVRWRPESAGRYSLRVVTPGDAARAAGVSSQWRQRVVRESAADVAKDILRDRGITLATVHLSAGRDGATAKDNMVDVADGRNAQHSCHGGAPCGSTPMDLRVLRAVREMGTRGTLTVSEFAGGTHAGGSDHYSGRAVDITWVNGRHVGWGSSYWMVVEVCRAHGASQVMHPANDPWGGHSRHVHCAW